MGSLQEEETTDMHRHNSVTTEAGIAVLWPQTKRCLEPPGTERPEKMSSEFWGRPQPVYTWIWGFCL